jgi:hypothetical protein
LVELLRCKGGEIWVMERFSDVCVLEIMFIWVDIRPEGEDTWVG